MPLGKSYCRSIKIIPNGKDEQPPHRIYSPGHVIEVCLLFPKLRSFRRDFQLLLLKYDS